MWSGSGILAPFRRIITIAILMASGIRQSIECEKNHGDEERKIGI